MRKIHRSLVLAGFAALALAGCKDDEVTTPTPQPGITSVSVNPTSGSVRVGQQIAFAASVQGTGGAATTVNWSTSNAAVATVANGIVTGVSAGTALITATSTVDATKSMSVPVVVTALQVTSVTVTPSQASIAVGGTTTLSAIVQGDAGVATTVTWSSGNTAVATVSATGVVTGVAPGTVAIIARSTADNTKQGAATVTVTGSTFTSASVSIQSVTFGPGHGALVGQPVNPGNVSGTINVTLNVEPGTQTINKVELLIGGVVCATQNITINPASLSAAQLSAVPIVMTCNTADFNASTGAARFPNGNTTLSARITTTTAPQPPPASIAITLANQDVISFTVTRARQAIAPATGLLWYGGDVTVSAVPVTYSGGAIASVTITSSPLTRRNPDGTAAAGDGATISKTATAAQNFTVVFPEFATAVNNGMMRVLDQNVTFNMSSLTQGGAEGPTVTATPAFRYDDVAPVPGALVLVAPATNQWLNSSYAFSAGKTGHSDLGVGGVSVSFHTGPAADAALSDSAFVAKYPASRTGPEGLADTNTNDQYIVVARVTDLLGNSSYVRLGTFFGVDITPPNLQWCTAAGAPIATCPAASVADKAINPGAVSWHVRAIDISPAAGIAGSGANTNGYMTKVERNAPGLTAAQRCVVGTLVSGVCQPVATDGDVPVPASEGYHTITVFGTDNASNPSNTLTRVVLVDVTAPTVTDMTVPGTRTGGTSAAFSANGNDNVDLFLKDFRLGFGALGNFPLTMVETIAPRFDATLTPTAPLSQTVTFIRSVEQAAPAPSGTPVATTVARFQLWDAALNMSLEESAAAPTAGTPASFNTRNVATFGPPTNSGTTICNGAGCGSGPTPTSRTVTISATGPSGVFANPFTAVNFYLVDAGGMRYLAGSAAAPASTDDGVTRTWTWSGTITAAARIPGTYTVQALGIHSSGDALVSGNSAAITVSGTAHLP